MSEVICIIPSYLASDKHAIVLMKCISTLRKSGVKDEVLIVDDGSDEKWHEVYEDIKLLDEVDFILKGENSGFSSTVNIGLQKALDEGKDACLINADIEFKEIGWLPVMQETEADIIGALLLYPNLLIQHAGIYFSFINRGFDHRFAGAPPNLPAANVSCDCPVTGALQYIRHSVLDDVGIYDEEFKMGHEDVDFMIRAIDKGHKSQYNPKVKAIHHESLFRSSGTEKLRQWQDQSYITLLKKYQGFNFSEIAPTLWDDDGRVI